MDTIDCIIWLCTGVIIGGVFSPIVAWGIVHFSDSDHKKHKHTDEDLR